MPFFFKNSNFFQKNAIKKQKVKSWHENCIISSEKRKKFRRFYMNDLALFNNLFDAFDDDRYLPSFNYKKVFHSPKVDISEGKDAYTLQMDMPGKTENDVNIELNNNVLTISSSEEKKSEKEEKSEKKGELKWLLKERSYCKFSRSFTLPDDVDSENLSANVKNGVLTVNMPRKAIAAPKRIAITCA